MSALQRRRRDTRSPFCRDVGGGQAIIEFAIVSFAFFAIVLGTIDFGRAIYLQSQLEGAVRDAARQGKVGSANGLGVNTADLKHRVKVALEPETGNERARPGLQSAAVTVSCSSGCVSGERLTVSASLPFQAVTQEFLGLSPLTLRASATVQLE